MTIVEFLKSDEYYSARVTCGNRWLVSDADEWVVYERRYGKATGVEVIRTQDESLAVEELSAG